MRTIRPAFKFELLPLHSPLLGQSLLVSFPPLIDMLKFSGYPYLIRGQPEKNWGLMASTQPDLQSEKNYYARSRMAPPLTLGPAGAAGPNTKQSLRVVMTLGQACPPEYQGAQCAFKDSMIH